MGFVEASDLALGEAGTLPIAGVGLRRLERPPVGGHLEPDGVDVHEILIDVFHARVQEELLDRHLDRGVLTLAEVVVTDPSVDVGDVDGRPEVVRERAPDRVVGVECDRKLDPEVARLAYDVVDVSLEPELRRVHPDDGEAGVAVLRRPGPDIGQRPEPVDARVCPEVDEDHPSPESFWRQRLGVEPAGRAAERCQVPLDWQPELLACEAMSDGPDQAGPAGRHGHRRRAGRVVTAAGVVGHIGLLPGRRDGIPLRRLDSLHSMTP